MGWFGKTLFFMREYFLPFGCGICGNTLLTKDETWYGLCNDCMTGLCAENILRAERCDLCGRPLVSEFHRCLQCRANAEIELPAYDRVIAIFPFLGKYRKLLGAYKFGKSLATGHFLAEKLLDAAKLFHAENTTDNIMEKQILVPVPPRPGKIHRTGWDQIESLAKLISHIPDSPEIVRCLKRKASQTQKELDRQDRRTNLKGRIIAEKAPKNCILFDDVITTGSTLNACAAALKSAGAERVYGICLFYD